MRLLNSLLDHLTDLNPEVQLETNEHRKASLHALRQSVQRDISWLLNATSLSSVQDLGSYPYVSESVINYGFRDIAGKTILDIDPEAIAQLIREAILTFEPRLVRHTVCVSVLSDQKKSKAVQHRNTLSFLIEGDLWAQPLTERLCFRTELDFEADEVRVIEQSAQ